MPNKILYSRDEVAELLGVSLPTVIDLCKPGQLRSIKIGRAVRVHVDDFDEFVRKGTQNRTTSGKPLNRLWQGKGAAA